MKTFSNIFFTAFFASLLLIPIKGTFALDASCSSFTNTLTRDHTHLASSVLDDQSSGKFSIHKFYADTARSKLIAVSSLLDGASRYVVGLTLFPKIEINVIVESKGGPYPDAITRLLSGSERVNAISWDDPGTADQCDHLKREVRDDEFTDGRPAIFLSHYLHGSREQWTSLMTLSLTNNFVRLM